MASAKPETLFDIEDLLTQMNESFTKAALGLRKEFDKPEWADSPYVYHMPKMSIEVRLVLSHSDGKVKGFFRKESSEERQEVTSTVTIDVVAVPRLPPGKS
ncbi:MAG: hypothetical protein AB7N65_17095 [Vicinamibacterales bacterium]